MLADVELVNDRAGLAEKGGHVHARHRVDHARAGGCPAAQRLTAPSLPNDGRADRAEQTAVAALGDGLLRRVERVSCDGVDNPCGASLGQTW